MMAGIRVASVQWSLSQENLISVRVIELTPVVPRVFGHGIHAPSDALVSLPPEEK